jgi:hypothetical protein
MLSRIVLGVGLASTIGCGAPAPAQSPASGGAHISATALLPARVRRLSNLEYERTVSELVGASESIADRLPPDVREEGYTVNAEQAVPSAWQARAGAIAREVAHRAATERLAQLAPFCDDDVHACGERFVERMGRRAYRRPLDPAEKWRLREAFEQGAAGQGGLAAGIEITLAAFLGSPSLLYVTEVGEGGLPGHRVTLTSYEIASELSYMLRGGPPDDELLDRAGAGVLASAEGREREARRLLSMTDTRRQFRRFILEWLEVDGLARAGKSERLYPKYDGLKSHMLDETSEFVDEVMVYGGGSVRALLDARFASVDPAMARFYGLASYGPRASLRGTERAGILQQASFLAAHAHEDETSPVKRGDFVLRKLLCEKVPRPGEVGVDIVFPPPSKSQTTRERYASHTEVSACNGCHERLDAIGFTFEGFDAIGAARTAENDQPVDTRAQVELEGRAISFANSKELSHWLAERPEVGDCYARQAFRFFAAEADPHVEAAFDALRLQLPEGRRDNLFEMLMAYIRSDLFIVREVRA